MKKYRIIATMVMIALAAFTLVGCTDSGSSEPTDEQARIEELEEKVSQLTTENDGLTSELESAQALANSSDTDFISTFFWTTGVHYNDDDTTFYSDCFCSQELTGPVVFVSPQTVGVDLKNGFHVYAALSTDGIVWSTEDPNLNPIDEDN